MKRPLDDTTQETIKKATSTASSSSLVELTIEQSDDFDDDYLLDEELELEESASSGYFFTTDSASNDTSSPGRVDVHPDAEGARQTSDNDDELTFAESIVTKAAVSGVLHDMGMYDHFAETILRSKLKTVTTINNFSTFLLFVNQTMGWEIDVSKPVEAVDKLIEYVISKGFMLIGKFCKYLLTTRSLSPASILTYLDSLATSVKWFVVYYAPERERSGNSNGLVGVKAVINDTRHLYRKMASSYVTSQSISLTHSPPPLLFSPLLSSPLLSTPLLSSHLLSSPLLFSSDKNKPTRA